MFIKNKRLPIILTSIPFLLLLPLIAMQFTNQVNWSLFDFLVMGILLLGTGLTIDLILRTVKKKTHRIILGMFVLFLFFLIWIELAVGIFNTPFAGS